MIRTLRLPLTVALLACATRNAVPPPVHSVDDADPELIARIVDPVIRRAMAEDGIPGAAFIFVKDDRVILAHHYGFADRERGQLADERTVWPLASISKVFTATAALQLVDRGALTLYGDINSYLVRVAAPATHGTITLANLLSHTAALDELPGRQFDPAKGHAPETAEFLRGRLISYRAPGASTAYSTYGIALAAVAVEDAAGLPLEEFLRRHVFEPCGMASARFMRRTGDDEGVATPYAVQNGAAQRIPHEWYATPAASSLVATSSDVARFIGLHLRDGRCGDRRILSEQLIQAMRTQQATVHPWVPGWGYGFQIDGENSRWTAEHGGDIGGFSALLTLVPKEGTGFFIVHHGEGHGLRFRVKQALFDALYPDPEPRPAPVPAPASAAALREYAGRYRSSLSCHTCPNTRGAVEFEVAVRDDGYLELWGQRWVALDNDRFIRVDGEARLAFGRDPRGRITAVSGGSWRVAERIEIGAD